MIPVFMLHLVEAYGLGNVLDSKVITMLRNLPDDDGNYIKTSLFSMALIEISLKGCSQHMQPVHAMKTAVIIAEFSQLKTGLQSWCATNKLLIDYGLEATKYHDTLAGYYSQSLSSIMWCRMLMLQYLNNRIVWKENDKAYDITSESVIMLWFGFRQRT